MPDQMTKSVDAEGSATERICAVVVNYQTPDLLDDAVRSFKRFYPDVEMIIVDNGSADDSREVIEDLVAEHSHLHAEYFDSNRGHGPAMHHAVGLTDRPFIFFLDSDTVTERGGFLEEMIGFFDEEKVYGVGKRRPFNRRGFEDQEGSPMLIAAHMLLRRSIYLSLPPFIHHGAPVVENFTVAAERGYRLIDYQIEDAVRHLHRGTVNRFGYGLGLKGRINYLLNKLGL